METEKRKTDVYARKDSARVGCTEHTSHRQDSLKGVIKGIT